MTGKDARTLDAMMRSEKPEYLRYFTAFAEKGELLRQQEAAKKDIFFTLFGGQQTVGFFCLRGLDAGYERPSFGVYVASNFLGAGAGRLSLQHALNWCVEQKISSVMLKVAKDNITARNMYKSAGFELLGICPDTGNLIMEKRLN